MWKIEKVKERQEKVCLCLSERERKRDRYSACEGVCVHVRVEKYRQNCLKLWKWPLRTFQKLKTKIGFFFSWQIFLLSHENCFQFWHLIKIKKQKHIFGTQNYVKRENQIISMNFIIISKMSFCLFWSLLKYLASLFTQLTFGISSPNKIDCFTIYDGDRETKWLSIALRYIVKR